jgi:type II restriction/modification system DNA methylase subunit YeeA
LTNNTDKQVKSKKRVTDHGEVFTNQREVNAMLDLVKHETERIESRFLEPACGNGNFLAEVLNRKLNVVNGRYKKSQLEWERNALIAIASIYGVDILKDNASECQERLFAIFSKKYVENFGTNAKIDYLKSIKFIIQRNILWGNALDFTNPETKKPIVFTEWSMFNGNKVIRRDYIFKFLVEKTHQFVLDFNDEGQTGAIDEPIKDYPPIDYLKLGN